MEGTVKFIGEFDSSLAEQQIESFRKKLETIKIDIPASAIGSITNNVKKLNSTVIVPKVDHKPLTDLNKHIDVKIAHIKKANAYFKNNPLKVVYEDDSKQNKSGKQGATVVKQTERIIVIKDNKQELILLSNIFKSLSSLLNNYQKTVKETNSALKNIAQVSNKGASTSKKELSNINKSTQANKPSFARDVFSTMLGSSLSKLSDGFFEGLKEQLEINLGVDLKLLGQQVANYSSAIGKSLGMTAGELINNIPVIKFLKAQLQAMSSAMNPLIKDLKQMSQVIIKDLRLSIPLINKILANFEKATRKNVKAKEEKIVGTGTKSEKRQNIVKAITEKNEEISAILLTIVNINKQYKQVKSTLEKEIQEAEKLKAKITIDARKEIEKAGGKETKEGKQIATKAGSRISAIDNVITERKEEVELQVSVLLEDKKEQQSILQDKKTEKSGLISLLNQQKGFFAKNNDLKTILSVLFKNKNVPDTLLPNVEAKDTLKGQASYAPDVNTIYVPPELFAKLAENVSLTVDEIESLIHELGHGINSAFGTFDDKVIAPLNTVPENQEESDYINEFRALYSPTEAIKTSQGYKPTRDEEATVELNAKRKAKEVGAKRKAQQLTSRSDEQATLITQQVKKISQIIKELDQLNLNAINNGFQEFDGTVKNIKSLVSQQINSINDSRKELEKLSDALSNDDLSPEELQGHTENLEKIQAQILNQQKQLQKINDIALKQGKKMAKSGKSFIPVPASVSEKTSALKDSIEQAKQQTISPFEEAIKQEGKEEIVLDAVNSTVNSFDNLIKQIETFEKSFQKITSQEQLAKLFKQLAVFTKQVNIQSEQIKKTSSTTLRTFSASGLTLTPSQVKQNETSLTPLKSDVSTLQNKSLFNLNEFEQTALDSAKKLAEEVEQLIKDQQEALAQNTPESKQNALSLQSAITKTMFQAEQFIKSIIIPQSSTQRAEKGSELVAVKQIFDSTESDSKDLAELAKAVQETSGVRTAEEQQQLEENIKQLNKLFIEIRKNAQIFFNSFKNKPTVKNFVNQQLASTSMYEKNNEFDALASNVIIAIEEAQSKIKAQSSLSQDANFAQAKLAEVTNLIKEMTSTLSNLDGKQKDSLGADIVEAINFTDKASADIKTIVKAGMDLINSNPNADIDPVRVLLAKQIATLNNIAKIINKIQAGFSVIETPTQTEAQPVIIEEEPQAPVEEKLKPSEVKIKEVDTQVEQPPVTTEINTDIADQVNQAMDAVADIPAVVEEAMSSMQNDIADLSKFTTQGLTRIIRLANVFLKTNLSTDGKREDKEARIKGIENINQLIKGELTSDLGEAIIIPDTSPSGDTAYRKKNAQEGIALPEVDDAWLTEMLTGMFGVLKEDLEGLSANFDEVNLENFVATVDDVVGALQKLELQFGLTKKQTQKLQGFKSYGKQLKANTATLETYTPQPLMPVENTNAVLGDLSVLGRSSNQEIGEDYINGIIYGVNNKEPELLEAISHVGKGLDLMMKMALEEKSPSKKGFQKGAWYVEGIILGVRSRVKQLSETVLKSVANVILQQSKLNPELGAVGNIGRIGKKQKPVNIPKKQIEDFPLDSIVAKEGVIETMTISMQKSKQEITDLVARQKGVNEQLLWNEDPEQKALYQRLTNAIQQEIKAKQSSIQSYGRQRKAEELQLAQMKKELAERQTKTKAKPPKLSANASQAIQNVTEDDIQKLLSQSSAVSLPIPQDAWDAIANIDLSEIEAEIGDIVEQINSFNFSGIADPWEDVAQQVNEVNTAVNELNTVIQELSIDDLIAQDLANMTGDLENIIGIVNKPIETGLAIETAQAIKDVNQFVEGLENVEVTPTLKQGKPIPIPVTPVIPRRTKPDPKQPKVPVSTDLLDIEKQLQDKLEQLESSITPDELDTTYIANEVKKAEEQSAAIKQQIEDVLNSVNNLTPLDVVEGMNRENVVEKHEDSNKERKLNDRQNIEGNIKDSVSSYAELNKVMAEIENLPPIENLLDKIKRWTKEAKTLKAYGSSGLNIEKEMASLRQIERQIANASKKNKALPLKALIKDLGINSTDMIDKLYNEIAQELQKAGVDTEILNNLGNADFLGSDVVDIINSAFDNLVKNISDGEVQDPEILKGIIEAKLQDFESYISDLEYIMEDSFANADQGVGDNVELNPVDQMVKEVVVKLVTTIDDADLQEKLEVIPDTIEQFNKGELFKDITIPVPTIQFGGGGGDGGDGGGGGGFSDFLGNVRKSAENLGESLTKQFPILNKFGGILQQAFRVGVGFVFAKMIGGVFKKITDGAFDAALKVENLQRQLSFATGKNGIAELQRVRKEANAVGISFIQASEGLRQFSASTIGTSLNENAGEIVSQFQKSFATFGLNNEQQEGAFLALSQMASKGVVSMEELRAQLAERLPGALNAAARSMGMTTVEFMKMVESGQVLSEDLLPAFASQLENESALGLATSARSTQAELTRLESNIFNLQAGIGQIPLALANLGLPYLNSSLQFVTKHITEIIVAMALLSGASVIAFVAAFKAMAGSSVLLAKALGLVSLGLKTIWASMAPMLPFIALAVVATKAIINLHSYLNAGSKEIKEYSKSLEDLSTAMDAIKNKDSKPKEFKPRLDNDFKGFGSDDYGWSGWRRGAKGFIQATREEMSEFWDFVTNRSAKAAKAFNTDIDRIGKANQAAIDIYQSARGNNDIDLGNGVTIKDDYSEGSLQAIQDRLTELRAVQQNLKLQIAVASDQGDAKFLESLNKNKAEVEKEIQRVQKESFMDSAVIAQGIQAQQAMIGQIQMAMNELNINKDSYSEKDFNSRMNSYKVLLQDSENALANLLKREEQQQKAIKANIDLYTKQITSLRILQQTLANIEYKTGLQSIDSQIGVLTKKLSGPMPDYQFDTEMRQVRMIEIQTKFTLSAQAFKDYESDVMSHLSKISDKTKQSIAEFLKIDNLDSAILNKQISPETLAKLTSEQAPTAVKEAIETESELKALVDKGQEYLRTWQQIKQQQLESVNLIKEQQDALKQRIEDLRGFARSLEDLDVAVRDYLKTARRGKEDIDVAVRDYEIQKVRGLEDFVRQVEDASLQYRRQQRDLIESYQDMNRQLLLQSAQVKKAIDETTRDIERRSILNSLRSNLRLGGGGLFDNFFDAIDQFLQSQNEIQNEQGGLEEQRLQLQEDVIAIAKQIRGLQEQLYDMERQRILQVRDLLRQHVDYIKGQLDAHRNITRQLEDFADTNKDSLKAINRQFEDMETQARSIGVKFDNIFDAFNGINTNYSSLNSAITGLVGTVKGLREQARQELANSRKSPNIPQIPQSSTSLPAVPNIKTPTTPTTTKTPVTPRTTPSPSNTSGSTLRKATPQQAVTIINNISPSKVTRTDKERANDVEIMRQIAEFIRRGEIIFNINTKGEVKSIEAKTITATNLLGTGNRNSTKFKQPETFVYNSKRDAQLGTVLNNLNTWRNSGNFPEINRPHPNTNTNPYGGTNPTNPSPYGNHNRNTTNPYSSRQDNFTGIKPATPTQAINLLGNIPPSDVSRTDAQKIQDRHIRKLIEDEIAKGNIVININAKGEIKSIQAKTIEATNLLGTGNIGSGRYKQPETFVYDSKRNAQLGTVLNNIKTWFSTPKENFGDKILRRLGLQSSTPNKLNFGIPQEFEQNAGVGNPQVVAQRLPERTDYRDEEWANIKTARDAIIWTAKKLQVNTRDLAALASFESGSGNFSTSNMGGTNNQYMGWMQLSPDAREKLGVKPGASQQDYALAVVRYFREFRGGIGGGKQLQPGASLQDMYNQINPGFGNVRPYLERGGHFKRADKLLGDYSQPQVAQSTKPQTSVDIPIEQFKPFEEASEKIVQAVEAIPPQSTKPQNTSRPTLERITGTLKQFESPRIEEPLETVITNPDAIGENISENIIEILPENQINPNPINTVQEVNVQKFDANNYLGDDGSTKQIDINRTRQTGADLVNLKLQEFSLRKIQLQLKATEVQRQGANALIQALRSQADLLRQQLDTYHSINKEVRQLSLNAKGFVTPGEQVELALTDVLEKYRNSRKGQLDFQRQMQILLNVSGTGADELRKEAIAKITSSNIFKGLPPEIQEVVSGIVDEYGNVTAEGYKELERITEVDIPRMFETTNQAERIELEFVGKMTRIDIDANAVQTLKKFADEMLDGTAIIAPDRNIDLAKLSKRFEVRARELDINRMLETEVAKARATLNDPNASKQNIQDAQDIIKLHEEYIRESGRLYKAVIDKSDREIEKTLIDSFQSRQSDVLKTLGEKQKEHNPFGGGSSYLAEAERLDIAIRYRDQLNKIKEMEESGKYEPQLIVGLRKQVKAMQDMDLSKVEEKFNIFAQAIREPLNQAFTAMFTDVIKGTKSIGDVLLQFLDSVASFFANIAAQLVTNQVMGWFKQIGMFAVGAVGGAVAPVAVPTTSVAPGVQIAKDGGEIRRIANYINGGLVEEIANFADGGLVGGIYKAMQKEGFGAVPIVAHVGEQVLTDRNGDAQLFRQLEANGEWNRIKQDFKYNGNNIRNFNYGGSVGNVNTPTMRTTQSNPQGSVFNYAINVTTKDADSFRKSKSLIAQEQKLMMERNNRFN